MMNITTASYRRFCRNFSEVGLVCVPMLYMKRLQAAPKTLELELHGIEQERPLSIQLIGNDVNALKESLLFLDSYEFDIVDINAGCPSKRAIQGNYGGSLLNNLNKLKDLISTATKYSSRPVSLKIRTGVKKELNITTFSRFINDFNLEYLTVHARTVEDRFEESALNLEFVRDLKNHVNIPIVGNGDIFTPTQAKEFFDYTNADALMIGRGSMGNPELFRHINEFLSNGTEIPFENNKAKMKENIEVFENIMNDYLKDLTLTYSNEEFRFVELKRNAIWLTKNIENSKKIREDLSKTKSLTQLKLILEEYFKSNN